MGVLRRLLETIIDVTHRLDEEVEKGFDLSRWGDQMKFLHALQIQAQALIDLVLRGSSVLGHPPSTPIDAARHLLNTGVMSSEDLALFRRVLGFRNVVIHEYVSIDLGLVERVLRSREYRRVLELAEKVFRELAKRGCDP